MFDLFPCKGIYTLVVIQKIYKKAAYVNRHMKLEIKGSLNPKTYSPL